jgi:N-acetylneuraminate synthase
MEPAEMKELVEETGRVWQALGKAFIGPTEAEMSSITFRRSLYIVKDLKAGDILTKENVRAIRPGLGLPPKHLNQVLGKKIKSSVKMGTALAWSLIG